MYGKIYEHYKGGLYEFLSLARLESSDEMMVIYSDLETGQKWVRPEAEFKVKFKIFKQRYNND